MDELKVLGQLLDWHETDRKTALARVIETWGSSPRPVGAMLVVNEAGQFEGSVSGGCIEGEVVLEALDLIASGGCKVLEFGVSNEMAWQLGLSCGGMIKVFVESIDDDKATMFKQIVKFSPGRVRSILLSNLDAGDMACIAGPIIETNDIGGFSNNVLAAAVSMKQSGMVATDQAQHVFAQIFEPALKLIIVGAVHIAQVLAPMAQQIGFGVTVIDPREGFANKERFGGVHLLARWPQEVLDEFDLDTRTALVTLTHDPKIDDIALQAAMQSDCFYIGALGSTRTHKARRGRLGHLEGFSRIDAPVGLDIGARGASEIAVSILAGIVAKMRGKDL